MSRRPVTADELCRQHMVETPHAEHVARCAVRIFDAVRGPLCLRVGERVLLETACRLHDIGFSMKPEKHAERGAELVAGSRLRGLTEPQRDAVAAAILLHGSTCRDLLDHPVFRRLKRPRRALRLAAFLQVADGLDHSHLQDAVLDEVSIRGDRVCLDVVCRLYPNNVNWAQKKAVLWPEVFNHRIRIKLVAGPSVATGFDGIVAGRDSVLTAARRLLIWQYRVIGDNTAGALQGENPACLHDIRVAMRRFRAVLRFCRRPLRGTSVPELTPQMQAISRALGPVRDRDAWLEFLGRDEIAAACATDPRWPDYLREEQETRAALRDSVRKVIGGDPWHRMMCSAALALKCELVAAEEQTDPRAFRTFSARRIKKFYSRVVRTPLPEMDDEDAMHAFRRRIRRGRYWAEFSAPALGRETGCLAREFKKVADILGAIHDLDVHGRRLAEEALSYPAALDTEIALQRRQLRHRLEKRWKKLGSRKMRKRISKKLKLAGKETT